MHPISSHAHTIPRTASQFGSGWVALGAEGAPAHHIEHAQPGRDQAFHPAGTTIPPVWVYHCGGHRFLSLNAHVGPDGRSIIDLVPSRELLEHG